jgi:hypothetical protein
MWIYFDRVLREGFAPAIVLRRQVSQRQNVRFISA